MKAGEDATLRWDYFVTHYEDLERQKRDSHMTYKLTNGELVEKEDLQIVSILIGVITKQVATIMENTPLKEQSHSESYTLVQEH